MKFAFVDESFDEQYFYLTAVVVSNQDDLYKRIHDCHKLVKSCHIPPKVKDKLLSELKANELYRHKDTVRLYKKIIAILLDGNDDINIISIENIISGKFDKSISYALYEQSIKEIIWCIDDDNIIVFCDEYGDGKFKDYIRTAFSNDSVSIDFYDSCEIKPIQMADLLCSPIRKSRANTDEGVFELINCPITVKSQ